MNANSTMAIVIFNITICFITITVILMLMKLCKHCLTVMFVYIHCHIIFISNPYYSYLVGVTLIEKPHPHNVSSDLFYQLYLIGVIFSLFLLFKQPFILPRVLLPCETHWFLHNNFNLRCRGSDRRDWGTMSYTYNF